jgi:hypothetical protein
MPSAWLELDTDLKERLRDVLAEPRRPVTETELRKLSDEGRACRLLLGAELERLERRLGKADGDPHSSLGEVAEAYRRVHDFREHVQELDGLMAALDTRAREVRSSWRLRMTDRLR